MSIRAAKRRVSGPLDRSAFGRQLIALPPGRRSCELTRLSLYRLGLAGTYAKYRVVPRSAIVDYDGLRDAIVRGRGDGDLASFIEELSKRHGAPSRRVVEEFVEAASRLELRENRGDGPDPAERDLLDAWLRACSPRSAAGRALDFVELAVCFALRRLRQSALAVFLRASGAKT
jgi:hypothetical protein